jgi:hypothetical protein
MDSLPDMEKGTACNNQFKTAPVNQRSGRTPREKRFTIISFITSKIVNYTTSSLGTTFENCATMTKRFGRMARRGGS